MLGTRHGNGSHKIHSKSVSPTFCSSRLTQLHQARSAEHREALESKTITHLTRVWFMLQCRPPPPPFLFLCCLQFDADHTWAPLGGSELLHAVFIWHDLLPLESRKQQGSDTCQPPLSQPLSPDPPPRPLFFTSHTFFPSFRRSTFTFSTLFLPSRHATRQRKRAKRLWPWHAPSHPCIHLSESSVILNDECFHLVLNY